MRDCSAPRGWREEVCDTISSCLNFNFFSVQPLRFLCLCGEVILGIINHRDTENAEVAQRKPKLRHYPRFMIYGVCW